jgi:hypothetical protein
MEQLKLKEQEGFNSINNVNKQEPTIERYEDTIVNDKE